jgi:hypothetical protein
MRLQQQAVYVLQIAGLPGHVEVVELLGHKQGLGFGSESAGIRHTAQTGMSLVFF